MRNHIFVLGTALQAFIFVSKQARHGMRAETDCFGDARHSKNYGDF
jgi:hypothetical protein